MKKLLTLKAMHQHDNGQSRAEQQQGRQGREDEDDSRYRQYDRQQPQASGHHHGIGLNSNGKTISPTAYGLDALVQPYRA